MEFWKGNKPRKSRDKRIIGLDVETYDDEKGRKVFICASLCEEWCGTHNFLTIHSVDELIKYLGSRHWSDHYFVVTNIGFDIEVIFSAEHSHKFYRIIEKSKIYGAFSYVLNGELQVPQKTSNKISVYDTFNFVPYSVADLGEIVNVSKMESPAYLGKRLPKDKKEMDYLVKYCENDALISAKFMRIILDGAGMQQVNLTYTIASLSMKIFGTNYLKEHWLKPSKEVYDHEIKSYFGGRTEVFQRGHEKGKFYYYDVVSLYPSQMLLDMPIPKSRRKGVTSIGKIHEYLGSSEVIVKVPKTLNIPPLLFKQEIQTGIFKTIAPTGTLKGTYNHIDLREAIKYGCTVIPNGKCYYYTRSEPILKEFVIDMFNKRLECKKNNDPMQLFYKLIMNSFYGKTGQKARRSKDIIHIDNIEDIDKFLKEYPDHKVMNDFVEYFTSEEKIPIFSQPIFASTITAYARKLMYPYLVDCDAVYTDTDSIITRKKIKSGKNLGDWELEKTYSEIVTCKPKVYSGIGIDDKGRKINDYKAKGFKLGKNKTEIKKNWYKIIKGEAISQWTFTKFRTAQLSKAHHKSGILEQNQTRVTMKKQTLEDTKRVWEGKFNLKADVLERSTPIHIKETK